MSEQVKGKVSTNLLAIGKKLHQESREVIGTMRKLSETELREIRRDIIIGMISEDGKLQDQLREIIKRS